MGKEELYIQFGPMLIDAIVDIIKDEINLLRVEAGLPERTGTQLIDAINAKLESMEKYSWME